MAEDQPGFGERISGAVDRAKEAVGGGGEHQADEAEGRVQVVRELLRRFGDGEHDQFFEVFHEQVEWVAPRGERFPGAGSHSGRDAVREKFTGDVEQGLPAFGFRPDHYLDAEREEWVVTLGNFIGEGASGTFEAPGVVVWEFDGNKIACVRIYADSEAFPKPVKEDAEAEDDDEEGGRASGNGTPEAHEASEDRDRADAEADRGEEGAHRAAGPTAASAQDSPKEHRGQSDDGA